jgi:hypothetical protein
MTKSRSSRRWAPSVIALAIALPGCGATATEPVHQTPVAHVLTTASQATRMREFRQMIVGLYRVPGRAAPGEDPLDTLRRSLETQYGVAPGVSV